MEKITATYIRIKNDLERTARKIEINLTEIHEDVPHIDRIGCRVKTQKSFLDKASKEKEDGSLKYNDPFKEIQDFIGARIVVYYKNDLEVVRSNVARFYSTIENKVMVPEDIKRFGYEGIHLICSIPSAMYPSGTKDQAFPDFFELQIKTLYQHAWSQTEHGLGYKPGTIMSPDEERKLAFIAAQSWGADTMLTDIINSRI